MPRSTPFQANWKTKYGVEVTEIDPVTKCVSACVCRFCKYIGRTTREGASRKRVSTTNFTYFTIPFRAENIRRHLETQHVDDWGVYKDMSLDQKKAFWQGRLSRVDTLHNYWDLSTDDLTFQIGANIVDKIIGPLLFNPGDEMAALDADGIDCNLDNSLAINRAQKALDSKTRAMALFVPQDDGSYIVEIKTPMKFELAIDHISNGLSFRQTAAAINSAHRVCKIAKLAGLNDTIVGQWVRMLVGGCLQQISNILADPEVWAFALAFDGSTHRGTSFFDIRIRFGFRGVLYNFHLIALPQFDRHTAANIVNMLKVLMDALHPHWRKKLIGVAADGEPTMTGRIQGVVTKLVAEGEFDVVRVWCIPHQMDLVVRKTTEEIDEGNWIKLLYRLSVYLRGQPNLILEMGVTCPKKTNRWLHLGMVIDFVLKYKIRITSFIAERPFNAATPPVLTPTFWVICAAVAPAVARMNRTFVELQHRSLIISQQRGFVDSLMTDLIALFNIQYDLEGVDQLVEGSVSIFDRWSILISDMTAYIEDLGMHAYENWEKLDGDGKEDVIVALCDYALSTIAGLAKMQAERGMDNSSSVSQAPACMPADLVRMRPKDFREQIFMPRLGQLRLSFSEVQIEAVDAEHRFLFNAYKTPAMKSMIDEHSHFTPFNNAWDSIGTVNCSHLRRFCSGLASPFANTTSIESDFSILKWEKDEFRQNLLDLSLEGIFQAKQFHLLGPLCPTPAPETNDEDNSDLDNE